MNKSESAMLYSITQNDSATKLELTEFISRIERLDEEKKDILDQRKEVLAEAKGRGYDTRAISSIVSDRKRSVDDVILEQSMIELYKQCLQS
jgi:uncharacterized protein (UPF0335 family)